MLLSFPPFHPRHLHPFTSLSLTGEALKFIPSVILSLFPFFPSYRRVFSVFCFVLFFLALFHTKQKLSSSNSSPYHCLFCFFPQCHSVSLPSPYLCPRPSLLTFATPSPLSFIDFFILSMSALLSPTPLVSPISLYTVLYSSFTASLHLSTPHSPPL